MLLRETAASAAFAVAAPGVQQCSPSTIEAMSAPSGDKSVIIQILPHLSAIHILMYATQVYGNRYFSQ